MGSFIIAMRQFRRPILVIGGWCAFIVAQFLGSDEMWIKLTLLTVARVLP